MFFPFFQAVPYSRDFKRKCDYFRSKLKRPVSVVSCWCACALLLLISLLTYSNVDSFDFFDNYHAHEPVRVIT